MQPSQEAPVAPQEQTESVNHWGHTPEQAAAFARERIEADMMATDRGKWDSVIQGKLMLDGQDPQALFNVLRQMEMHPHPEQDAFALHPVETPGQQEFQAEKRRQEAEQLAVGTVS